jgi:hypothetical protein
MSLYCAARVRQWPDGRAPPDDPTFVPGAAVSLCSLASRRASGPGASRRRHDRAPRGRRGLRDLRRSAAERSRPDRVPRSLRSRLVHAGTRRRDHRPDSRRELPDFGFAEPISYAGPPVLNDAGQVAFFNSFTPATIDGSNTAIWGPGAGGALSLVARRGHALPGDGSGALLGQITSFPTLDDAGNDSVVFRSDGAGGPISFVAREGDAAPGTASNFSGAFSAQSQSDAGIAFVAGTTGGSGIWGPGGAGGLAPVVQNGDAAPGTSGAIFGGFNLSSAPRLDDSGGVSFRGALQTGIGGVTAANDTGLWGPAGLIAREGSQAPGTAAGAVFSTFTRFEHGNGGIAFAADLLQGSGGVTAANDTGLWRSGGFDGSILLAREGDAVPGLPGATFAGFTNLGSSATAPPVINDFGQTAFVASLTVGLGGVTAANDRAVFFVDENGNYQIVLREGEVIPLQFGNFGTLSDFALDPGALNNQRQIVLRGHLASPNQPALLLVTIPEPSSALLLALGLGGLAARRRRIAR